MSQPTSNTTLHAQIKGEIKAAMIAKDAVRLSVVRGLVASFMNEMITKKVGGETLPDDAALAVIRRAVNQRKDSIEQFTKGGRPELADAEKAELAILESYLPQMMSRDEIRTIAEAKKTEMGIAGGDKSKLGQFVGTLMKELKGKADGADVKAVAEEILK